jgi:flagellar basal-body rod protein FlgG
MCYNFCKIKKVPLYFYKIGRFLDMIRGLYTAAAGMNAQQHQIDVTSNNIANVNTTAFKQDRAEFQDLMYEALNYTAGATSEATSNPTGIDVGLGVRIAGIQKNFLQGSIKQTGNPLDIAIEGRGFFEITMPNGDTAYTRNGAFKVDSEGNIVNGQGYPLAQGITLETGATDISIAQNGVISYNLNGVLTEAGPIQLFDFTNTAGLTPHGNSLFMASDTSGDAVEIENVNVKMRQGMLESSNVKLVNEMVDLITAQRAYEANSKSITTTDTMLQQVNQLKR